MNNLFDFETTNSTLSPPSSVSLELSQPVQQMTQSSLIVAATGLGKTVIMAGLANHWPLGRVMMLSHRFELNQQALKTFEHVCGETVDLEQASYHADQYGDQHRIVVASVQTLNARRKGKYRMEKFDPFDFGLIMVDEAHRAAADTYRRVFKYFSVNPKCCIVGVTATPDRLDKVGLGCVFNQTACNFNISWGIENGWLVEPKQKFVQIEGLDLTQVRTVGGDLDEKQLAKIVELEDNLHAMAKPIVDVANNDWQTIVFTASVAQAHRLAELIRDYWVREFGDKDGDRIAVSLDGSLSPQDPKRRKIVSDFKKGDIQFLVNCGVATEGFDAPNVRVIAVGRPTKSRALYTQMIGRGTRPLSGVVDGWRTKHERVAEIADSDKTHCVVLDFVGQSGRHHLVCTTDILAGKEPKEVQERANKINSNKDFDGTALQAIQEAKEQLAIEEEARRKKVTVGVDYKLKDTATLYDLSAIPEVRCPGYMMAKRPSEKQTKFMLRLGFTRTQIEGMNPAQASKAIDHAIHNPANGFAKWLHKTKKKNGEL